MLEAPRREAPVYLSYFGIRVTDLRRSAEFYSRHLGLVRADGTTELPAVDPSKPSAVLLLDRVSGQRVELNYYPPGSPYAVPYLPGEGWDHLSFRVEDLPAFLARLAADGIRPLAMKHFDGPMLTTPEYRVAYVADPDGNEIELFDTPGGDAEKYDPSSF